MTTMSSPTHDLPLPRPASLTFPPAVILIVIITVLVLQPGPSAVTACGTVLLAVAETYRRLIR